MGLAAPESNGRSERTEALYREHGEAVAAFCRSRLHDRGEAEDATQQVFLSAHRALLNGTVPREPLAWLLAVARHECYARFRQRASTPLPAGDAPEGATADASVHVLRAGELASIWDEVGQMPPAQRDAFLLREIRGLSYGQLASELSLSPPSVRSLLLRARTRLRSRLGDVAAGVGGAPWVQTLLRFAGGGEGASPVPAATKALAVGVGALALAGGGDVPRLVHRASSPPAARRAGHHRPAGHGRRVAAPVPLVTARHESRPRIEHAVAEHSRGVSSSHDSDSGADRSGSPESRDGSSVTNSDGGSQQTSGGDGGKDTSTTPTVSQPASGGSGSGDRSSGSGSGSDGGGPGPTSTTSSSTSDGGPDSSSSSGHDGSQSSSDGGGDSSHDGGGSGG